jgi:hypothetical protein
VGTFLPEAKLRELIAERDALRSDLHEAQRELDRLRLQEREYQRQLSALEAEREDYHRALTAAVRDQFPVIDDETALALIAEAETNGVDGAEVLRQVDAICRADPAGGAHAG